MKSKIKIFSPLLFFLILGVICSLKFFSKIPETVYQCDEYSYLQKSYFLDLYLSGRFSDKSWQNGDATDQTKLMEYIYGIPSKILYQRGFIELAFEEGKKDHHSYANYADWAVTYGQPAKNLNISPKLKNVLYIGRIISAFLTVAYILLSSLIIFWLFRSYALTILSFIFLSLHPIINIHGKQILADSGLNFFLSLGLAILLLWWQAFWGKFLFKDLIFLTVACGIIGGLSASAKLNGFTHLIISEIIFTLAGFLLLLKKGLKNKKEKLNKLVLFSTISIAITLTIFLLLHPNTWTNPISETKKFIDWRWYLTNYYQGYFSEDNITSLEQKITFIFLRTAGYMTGVGSIGFHYEGRFGDSSKLFYLIPNTFLFSLGIYGLIKEILKKDGYKKILFPAAGWSIITIFVVGFYLRLDWTRYYWPLFLPFIIIDSLGLKILIQSIKDIVLQSCHAKMTKY